MPHDRPSGERLKIQFDNRVSLGNIVSIIAMIIAMVLAWTNLERKFDVAVTRLETKVEYLERNVSELQRIIRADINNPNRTVR